MDPGQFLEDLPFVRNQVLFGHDPAPGLVAVEIEAPGRVLNFYRRGDQTIAEADSLRPFMLLAGEKWLRGWRGDFEVERLEGSNSLNRLVFFPDFKQADRAKAYLQKKSGKSPSAPDAPYLYLSDPVYLYLLFSGKTHFLGLTFNELKRLQLDIETYCEPGYEFPNAAREQDRITAIALADSTGWERLISGKDYDEVEMLRELVRTIEERDPDVLEGHNLFRFDLEYIEARARRHGVELRLGRDGSSLRGRSSRMQIAERAIAYRKYEIFGRHVVDTWILAQHYDVATRDLEGYGLKEITRHFGIESANRTYIPAERAAWYFDHDPDTLFRYALDDVRETRALSELLSPSYFVEAQIFPYSYQNVCLRGNATKIDALFLREYLYRRHSVPQPGEVKEVSGGYTAVEFQGVARRVLHCDVTSLYPSIMLAFGYFPSKDQLGIFPGLLRDLKEFRVRAKELARGADKPELKIYFSALQASFKILINSFYGYLGFALGHFNDFDVANQVTAKGRELIRSVVAWLKARGATVIEIDTDGIYFMPPGEDPGASEEDFARELAGSLPAGIELEIDGRYPAMFSYKMKNYALLDENGRLLIKGSGLRSRGLELFQRQWLEEMLLLLLRGEEEKIADLYRRYLEDIERHRLDISLLMKTETLQDSLETYRTKVRGKKRNAAAPYEIALRSARAYQPGDQISYYVTGSSAKVKISENCKAVSEWNPQNPDENVEHYKAKLHELYEKFRPFIEGEKTADLLL